MTVRVLPHCDGCAGARSPRCELVCPGHCLEVNPGEQASLRDPSECWDCAACLKACPREALELYRPLEMGGRGASLRARTMPDRVKWTCRQAGGRELIFTTIRPRLVYPSTSTSTGAANG